MRNKRYGEFCPVDLIEIKKSYFAFHLQYITWKHCCNDKEPVSKLQIQLEANQIHTNAQHHHRDQQQWPSQQLIVAAIAENVAENGCLQVNVVNRTIPIFSATTTSITSTATCLRLLQASQTPLPLSLLLLNVVKSHTNFGIGASILCVHIHFDCTATKMFLPLHQQIHCQTMKPTNVTTETEMKMNCMVVDSIAQSMCTNKTKIPTTNKLVEANAMYNATYEIVNQTLDQCKAIKFKITNLRRRCEYNYTERPNQMSTIKANGQRRISYANCANDNDNDDDRSGDSNANAFTSMRETSNVAERRNLHTERRHHYSKVPNKFKNVNTIYIEYRKMFCTFLLPLLLLLCNLTPSIHAGEYNQQN